MFKKIVIGVDGSSDAIHAARLGAVIARSAHAEVVVFNAFNLGAAVALVAPDAMACSEVIIASGESAQQSILQQTSDLLTKKAVPNRTRAEIGNPVEATLRVAEEEKADLIVVGSHGLSGFQKILLGSVSDGVVHHAPCPVLVVRGATTGIHQILAAVDGSEGSYKALQAATQIAQPLRAGITVLHVLDSAKPFPGIARTDTDPAGYALLVQQVVTEHIDAMLKETGINEYRVCQEKGHPVEVITAFATANNIDLIIMGSHGAGAFQRLLLGSVSDAVLHHADCPVLIVR